MFLTAYWHSDPVTRVLAWGVVKKVLGCTAKFTFYRLHNLTSCPCVLVVCKNSHSHAPLLCACTPGPIKQCLFKMLARLEWKLVDATPRWLLNKSKFMDMLREDLHWINPVNPRFANLHPLYANLDYLRRHIEQVQKENYAAGTGFEGELLIST